MRVLVVDDEEAGRAYLRALLTGYGHEVVEAENGAQALEAARRQPPDLVISDILMPVMDGYRLCLEWREDGELAHIPFVFYTASYTDPADQELGSHLGADRFLLKPADPAELMAVIREVVQAERATVTPERAEAVRDDAATLKEYSERLVSKLEEKVVELNRANQELRRAQDLLAAEVEAKQELIEELHRDIEKRKRLEAQLRRERDFTSSVIDLSELAIVGLDASGAIEMFSRGAEELTGYRADEVLGRDWFETFVPPESREYHRSHLKRLLESGEGRGRMIGVVRTRSGEERIVHWSDAVRVEEGRVVGVFGFGLDITEKTRREVADAVIARLNDAVLFEEGIEFALQEFCERMAATLGLEIVMVCEKDADGSAVPRACSATGDRILRSSAMSIGLKAIESREVVEVRSGLPGASPDVTSALALPLAAFGKQRGAVVFASRFEGVFDTAFSEILRSTAERLAMVLALAENQQQLRLHSAALTSAASAILITDSDGVLVWANPAYEELTGRKLEDEIGRTVDIIRLGGDAENVEGLRQAMLEGRPFRGELESTRHDGSVVEEMVVVDPVLDKKGEVTNFVLVRQDITERKRLEQLKSDFLSLVSHELRTPLTSIIGFADLLLKEAEATDGERQRVFAEKIRSHSAEMHGLVEELLEVSQMQTDPNIRLNLESVDLAEVAEKAAGSLMLDESHRLEYDFKDAPEVLCDPEKVAHIVTNLVTNAQKYSPDGGTIKVSVYPDGEYVRLSVEDEGVGIDSADVDRIFDRFTQADMSSTREFGGFGLGLFIVKTIVDAHHGRVEVDSEVGKGSAFHVYLPVGGPHSVAD